MFRYFQSLFHAFFHLQSLSLINSLQTMILRKQVALAPFHFFLPSIISKSFLDILRILDFMLKHIDILTFSLNMSLIWLILQKNVQALWWWVLFIYLFYCIYIYIIALVCVKEKIYIWFIYFIYLILLYVFFCFYFYVSALSALVVDVSRTMSQQKSSVSSIYEWKEKWVNMCSIHIIFHFTYYSSSGSSDLEAQNQSQIYFTNILL